MITGGVGQAVASPTDVVKVRLQADGRLKAVGKAPRYQVREASCRRCTAGYLVYRTAASTLSRRRSVDGRTPWVGTGSALWSR